MRLSFRLASTAALSVLSLSLLQAQQAPAASVFPKPDPAKFTATSVSKEAINAFLYANLGFDDSQIWQVQSILKTPVQGIAKVVVLIGDKSGKGRPYPFQFFALPDGKHIIIRDEMMPFGDHPFAERRALLQQRADGPYRGSASKGLEIIEFADFQCPHCKQAQPNMDKLAADYPRARLVYENFPQGGTHPQSVTAATYGVCVTQIGGNAAFFQFTSALYENEDGLGTADGAILTLKNAVTKVGLDSGKVAACVATPAAEASVEASVKLAEDLDISQTPTLFINGRPFPANAPYETLKQVVDFQIKMDGLTP